MVRGQKLSKTDSPGLESPACNIRSGIAGSDVNYHAENGAPADPKDAGGLDICGRLNPPHLEKATRLINHTEVI